MSIIQFENGKRVEFDGTPTPADVEEIASKLNTRPSISSGGKHKGFFSGLGEDFERRKKSISEAKGRFESGEQGLAEGILQSSGQVAGFAGDVIGRGITPVAQTFC